MGRRRARPPSPASLSTRSAGAGVGLGVQPLSWASPASRPPPGPRALTASSPHAMVMVARTGLRRAGGRPPVRQGAGLSACHLAGASQPPSGGQGPGSPSHPCTVTLGLTSRRVWRAGRHSAAVTAELDLSYTRDHVGPTREPRPVSLCVWGKVLSPPHTPLATTQLAGTREDSVSAA